MQKRLEEVAENDVEEGVEEVRRKREAHRSPYYRYRSYRYPYYWPKYYHMKQHQEKMDEMDEAKAEEMEGEMMMKKNPYMYYRGHPWFVKHAEKVDEMKDMEDMP